MGKIQSAMNSVTHSIMSAEFAKAKFARKKSLYGLNNQFFSSVPDYRNNAKEILNAAKTNAENLQNEKIEGFNISKSPNLMNSIKSMKNDYNDLEDLTEEWANDDLEPVTQEDIQKALNNDLEPVTQEDIKGVK